MKFEEIAQKSGVRHLTAANLAKAKELKEIMATQLSILMTVNHLESRRRQAAKTVLRTYGSPAAVRSV